MIGDVRVLGQTDELLDRVGLSRWRNNCSMNMSGGQHCEKRSPSRTAIGAGD